MSEMSSWRDVKAKARQIDPDWDSPARVATRGRIREELLARVNGERLAEIRRSVDMTQAQLAEATGLTQARISQIENGDGVSLDTLRTYITGLGGQVDVVARVGTMRLDIA
ncbi:helix-turn-helix domain-containing protein [Pseudonocardia sp.]|uniref:helix-turn-helix domain-containing protein n=1 Tax=Pseudonocardia sp. TaxID=60912 RepID=UPI00261BADC0|nr:helix-turn-helix domain-containing protein [Pseudonocardia sp.]